MNAGLDGFQGPLKVEMHVGDDGDADLGDDFLEGGGVLLFRYGDAHEVGAGGGEFVNFRHALVDFPGIAGRHRLDADRGVAADADPAVGLVAESHLPRFSAWKHRLVK